MTETQTNPHAFAEQILAETKEIFPDWELFTPKNLSHYASFKGNTLIDHFGALKKQEKSALTDYILEQGKHKPFGEVLRALRITHGITSDLMAKKLYDNEYYSWQIGNVEKGDRPFSEKSFAVLLDENLFGLNDTQKQRLQEQFEMHRQSLPSYKHSIYKDKEALFDHISQQLKEYRAGERSLDELIPVNETFRQLLFLHEDQSVAALSLKLFPDKNNKFLSVYLSRGELQDQQATRRVLLAHLGIDASSPEGKALARLPNLTVAGHRHFSPEHRAEMVQPEIKRVMEQAFSYSSPGAFWKALREASDQTQHEIGTKLRVTRATVDRWEHDQNTPKSNISLILEKNPYELPVGADGKILSELATRLQVIGNCNTSEWRAFQRKKNNRSILSWDDMTQKLAEKMSRPELPPQAWASYFDEVVAPELKAVETGAQWLEVERFTIPFEGRDLRVIRHDKTVGFSSEDVEKLLTDRLFLTRLEAHLASFVTPNSAARAR